MRIVIEPGRAAHNYWRDLWHYRELLYILAWRDLAVRYKQTLIGVAWAVLRPGLTMLAFVAFRRLLGAPPTGIPEPLLVLSAVLPWQFFASALSESSGSVVGNASLISKVYFPRLIIPFATMVTSLVDFAITLGLLALVMAWYGFAPGWQILALPAFVALAFALASGAGILLAGLNVQYRDFRHLVPFLLQVGLFVSPIAYATADVPDRWRPLYALNPMVGVIDGFRWCLLRGEVPFNPATVATSTALTALLMVAGVAHFRRVERRFPDVI